MDDNPETLNLFATAIQFEGIEVRTANSVKRALEVLYDGSNRPSLIITDLLMPQTSGWDFLKHLRAEPGLKALPVIVITGAEPGEIGQLADLVMQKPIDPVELADLVRARVRPTPGTK